MQIFMSSFNFLGYSVAVGDFNDDGEDGKTFRYVSYFGKDKYTLPFKSL